MKSVSATAKIIVATTWCIASISTAQTPPIVPAAAPAAGAAAPVSVVPASAPAKPAAPIPAPPKSVIPQPAPTMAVPAAPAPVAALVIAPSNALVLRQGTAVRFATDQALSSQKSKLGDRFELRTLDPVQVGELLVIPAGTRAVGEVTRAEKKGAFGKSGKLDTRILFIVLGDQHIAITGKSVEQGSSGTVGVVVAAALFWPAMPFITGKSAEVPAGTTLTGYIENDLPLVAAAAVAPAPVAPLVVPLVVPAAPVVTPVATPVATPVKPTAIPTK